MRLGIFNTGSRAFTTCQNAVLTLVCLLPFLVPFSLQQNIDLQAFAVILTGLVAWFGFAVGSKKQAWSPYVILWIALITYVVFCFLSLLWHPTLTNLFGSALIRLGSLALVACVGCGMLLSSLDTKRLTSWLYGTCVALAAVTIPYTLLTAHHLSRLGGVFHQPDILAAWLACGVILGLSMWHLYPKLQKVLILSQLLLAMVLILTETRAVIALLIIIFLLNVFQSHGNWRRRIALGAGIIVILIIATLASLAVLPQRLTSNSYNVESISYRLHLQSFGLRATGHQPLIGYGAGSISNALTCPTLRYKPLQTTCHEGFYFDSTHNVFLDRILALGFIGGGAFIVIVAVSLYKGLGVVGSERYFALCSLLIAGYYFTNVTDIELELLFWILLMRPFRNRRIDAST